MVMAITSKEPAGTDDPDEYDLTISIPKSRMGGEGFELHLRVNARTGESREVVAVDQNRRLRDRILEYVRSHTAVTRTNIRDNVKGAAKSVIGDAIQEMIRMGALVEREGERREGRKNRTRKLLYVGSTCQDGSDPDTANKDDGEEIPL
jgi:hypothetical protein